MGVEPKIWENPPCSWWKVALFTFHHACCHCPCFSQALIAALKVMTSGRIMADLIVEKMCNAKSHWLPGTTTCDHGEAGRYTLPLPKVNLPTRNSLA